MGNESSSVGDPRSPFHMSTMSKLASWEAKIQISGQIIATSHDLTPHGGLLREIPLFQGNLGW